MNNTETVLKLMDADFVAQQKLKDASNDLLALNEPYRTFIAVWTAQGIIDNGSMTNFFETDFPHQPPYSVFVESYRRIGANLAADCLERAIASFPFENPERHMDLRNQFMDEHYDEKKYTVGIWDHSFCGDETIFERLLEFVELNRVAFPIKEAEASKPWWQFWKK